MISINRLFAYFLMIFTIILYLLHPNEFNSGYIKLCGVLFIGFILVYYKVIKKKNYFDFDSFFFISLFIATQYYPLFLHGTNLNRYFIFSYSFDSNLIPQGSGLALLGLSYYIAGALLYKNKRIISKSYSLKVKSNKLLYILALVSFVMYIILGGYERLKNLYAGGDNVGEEVGLSSYFFVLCPALLFVALVIEFINIKLMSNNFSIGKVSKLGFFVTLIIFIAILITGSRTIPLQLCLAIMGLYTYLFQPINLKKFLIIIPIGFISLFSLLMIRGAVDENNLIFSDLFGDLFGTNRTIFVAVEYTNKFGYTFGETMLGGLLSPIPFAQNFFINYLGFDKDMMGSSLLYTKYTLGSINNLGLGTNIIADLFFSFGFIGVAFFMFFLGKFIRSVFIRGNYNIYALTSYVVMLSYSVFLVRAEFFTFFRFLLWSLLLMYIIYKFQRKK